MSETCGKNCACAAAAAASSETKSTSDAKAGDTKTTEPKKADAPKGRAFRNGKGSAPRNISAKFRSNFDTIKWS